MFANQLLLYVLPLEFPLQEQPVDGFAIGGFTHENQPGLNRVEELSNALVRRKPLVLLPAIAGFFHWIREIQFIAHDRLYVHCTIGHDIRDSGLLNAAGPMLTMLMYICPYSTSWPMNDGARLKSVSNLPGTTCYLRMCCAIGLPRRAPGMCRIVLRFFHVRIFSNSQLFAPITDFAPLRTSPHSGLHAMRQRTLLAVIVVVSLAGSLPAASPFADKALEEVVRAASMNPKGDITDEMLKNLSILEATGKGIKDLSGLEKCTNLLSIRFDKNQISDLKPLKGLINLQSLDLAGNQISDITPLAGLTKLQYLQLENNKVEKVDAVKDLVALDALYLTGNQLSDIGPMAGLVKLSSVHLAKNKIKDLTPLAKVNRVMVMDLKDNEIADIGPLKSQSQLSMLMLERNKITDLTPLVEAAQADAKGPMRFAPFLQLYLAGNPLSDAKAKQLADLKAVGVRLKDAEK